MHELKSLPYERVWLQETECLFLPKKSINVRNNIALTP